MSSCSKEHCASVWGVLYILNPAVFTEAKFPVKNNMTMESTEYEGRKTPHKTNASA